MARGAPEGRFLRDEPAVLGGAVRVGLRAVVHRDVLGVSPACLRLFRGRAPPDCPVVRHARGAGPPPLGQRTGVHGPPCPGMAAPRGGQDALHRAREPVGERIPGVVQRQAPRPTAQRGTLRYAAGGQDTRRALARTLQHGEATQCSGLPSTGTRSHPALGSRLRYRRELRLEPKPPLRSRQTNLTSGTLLGGRPPPRSPRPHVFRLSIEAAQNHARLANAPRRCRFGHEHGKCGLDHFTNPALIPDPQECSIPTANCQ